MLKTIKLLKIIKKFLKMCILLVFLKKFALPSQNFSFANMIS